METQDRDDQNICKTQRDQHRPYSFISNNIPEQKLTVWTIAYISSEKWDLIVASAEGEPTTGIWGGALSGIQGQSLWSGGQGQSTLKLKVFFLSESANEAKICPSFVIPYRPVNCSNYIYFLKRILLHIFTLWQSGGSGWKPWTLRSGGSSLYQPNRS